MSIDEFEAGFKNIKQNNHLQTSFTAGNAMRPRQRMRTLRTNRREGKGFLKIRPDFAFTPLILAPGALQPGDPWQQGSFLAPFSPPGGARKKPSLAHKNILSDTTPGPDMMEISIPLMNSDADRPMRGASSRTKNAPTTKAAGAFLGKTRHKEKAHIIFRQ
ncbi:hypothetical protein H2O77_17105 [Cobetia sp. 4B]|uniref:hypothetical protein n=1 Tax=Cobetia sp. 4B TaxID=2758724 RepID=UPI001C045270|nr:hypothetical protein [Cobetia sp. 4B]QWN36862.1 hypothetical protein H2O77_17105 [Cobetia sp. 4B]